MQSLSRMLEPASPYENTLHPDFTAVCIRFSSCGEEGRRKGGGRREEEGGREEGGRKEGRGRREEEGRRGREEEKREEEARSHLHWEQSHRAEDSQWHFN